MSDLAELKKRYNQVLAREKRAEQYLDNQSIPLDQRLKWYEEFVNILREMNGLIGEIGPSTEEERLEGFAL